MAAECGNSSTTSLLVSNIYGTCFLCFLCVGPLISSDKYFGKTFIKCWGIRVRAGLVFRFVRQMLPFPAVLFGQTQNGEGIYINKPLNTFNLASELHWNSP